MSSNNNAAYFIYPCCCTEAKSLNHDLTLHLEKGSCNLLGAELLPEDVDVKDIIEAAVSEKLTLSFVVRSSARTRPQCIMLRKLVILC